MTETNELQPTPEVEAAEAQVTPAPAEETQAVESNNQEEITAEPAADEAPAEEPVAEEAPAEEAPAEEPAAEEAPVEEPVVEEAPAEEGASAPLYETKEQIVDRLKEIQEENNGGDKNELDMLKQVFYKLHRAAQMAARNAFIEQGGAPEDWRAEIDGAEENFKAIARLMLDELRDILTAKGMEFAYDDSVIEYLARKSYSVTYGARNLRRTIQKEIEDRIAAEIVDTHRGAVTSIALTATDDGVKITAE